MAEPLLHRPDGVARLQQVVAKEWRSTWNDTGLVTPASLAASRWMLAK